MNKTQKVCLVLGANGFIGSHLVDELVAKGYRVKAFDRFLGDTKPRFKPSDQVEVVAGDIYDKQTLRASLKGVGYVFHCFSATTPFSSDNDPVTDIEKNLKPSINIFQECVEHKIKKIAFMSSGGAIYGENAGKQDLSEDDVPRPVSPYGITKLGIEGYLAYFKRKFDLDYVVYRLSNPYGPRQAFRNNQGVIPAFIANIKEGKPLNVHGDGSASRDYIYIRDAARMMVEAFDRNNKSPIYNIGSGQQTTLNDIIKNLHSIMKEDFKVEFQEAPKTFLKSTGISIKRFEKEFGKQTMTELQTGLKQTINY